MKPEIIRLNQAQAWTGIITGLLCILFVVTACAPAAAQPALSENPKPVPTQVLKVSGAGGVTILLTAIKPAFEIATPGSTLEILSGSGTGGGVKGVIEGVLDVAAMARPPKADEAAKNVGYSEFGQAGQAIITHAEVGVDNLTAAQIEAIFFGQVNNWSEVGGPDLPLILYIRDEDDSTTKALRSFMKSDQPFSKNVARILTSQGDMLTAVLGTPGSVGIANWPAVLANKAKVHNVKVDGVNPGDPAYPIITPVGLGYLTSHQAQIQPLLDWLKSEQGRAALKEFEVIITP